MHERSTPPRARHRATGDDQHRAAQAAPSSELGAEIDRLRAELDAAQAQAAEHVATLQRTAADFANFRRRTAEDRERELGLAGEVLLLKVLAVADDFDRALAATPADLAGAGWVEGIALVDRKLRALLESEGVTSIEALGKPFDPHEHEAIASFPGTGRPDGEVVAEVQRGYRIRDRVLRPTLVAVAGEGGSPERQIGVAGAADPAGDADTRVN